jgi:hypothetical protein
MTPEQRIDAVLGALEEAAKSTLMHYSIIAKALEDMREAAKPNGEA